VEKELEEARAVFEKHGLQIPGEAQSRTSSVILFGDGKEKKRNLKENAKDEVRSIKSGISSNIKRSTAGKFEGGSQFGEHMFIKKGMARGK
jgi:hypothetical protein